MIDGFCLFDLRAEWRTATCFADQLLRVFTIARASDERKGDVVGVLLNCPFEIDDVFFGEGVDRQSDARQVDAFSLSEQTTVNHSANNICIVGAFYDQRQGSVVEQHSRAWF